MNLAFTLLQKTCTLVFIVETPLDLGCAYRKHVRVKAQAGSTGGWVRHPVPSYQSSRMFPKAIDDVGTWSSLNTQGSVHDRTDSRKFIHSRWYMQDFCRGMIPAMENSELKGVEGASSQVSEEKDSELKKRCSFKHYGRVEPRSLQGSLRLKSAVVDSP